ncbi:MAG: T9SS type A sorting domain-containing protein, partial [Calditrichota bacterium]
GQTKQEIYQMISIPVFAFGQDLEALFGDNLGAYDKTRYRIFDCMNGIDYTEITELNQTLSPGKSIWLIIKEARKLDVSNVQSVISNQNYLLPLHQGWNMIATPFAFPVDWTKIAPDLPLRYYDGTEWLFVSVMEPFKGYAVYVTNDTIISIPPQQAQSSTAFQKLQHQLAGSDWQIQIGVVSNQLKDRSNYAGVCSKANSNIDRFDYVEPPPIGNYVSLYLLPENQSTFYSTDYRQPGMEGYIFRIGFSANVSGEKTIKFNPENLPANFDWLVASEDTKIKYTHEEIKVVAKQALFRLFVGSTDFIEQASTVYLKMPTSFRLDQNYPNPFNPITLVKFQLPEREMVTIHIYDILGQHIRTLMDKDKMEPGYYEIQWNGLNDSGNQVASGIYFLQFRTQQINRTIKMILQR